MTRRGSDARSTQITLLVCFGQCPANLMIVASGDFYSNAERDTTGLDGQHKEFFPFINEVANSIEVRPIEAELTGNLLA